MVDACPEDQVHGTAFLGEGEIAVAVAALDRTDLHHHPVGLSSHPGSAADVTRSQGIVGTGKLVGLRIPREHVHAGIIESLQLADQVAVERSVHRQALLEQAVAGKLDAVRRAPFFNLVEISLVHELGDSLPETHLALFEALFTGEQDRHVLPKLTAMHLKVLRRHLLRPWKERIGHGHGAVDVA